MPRQSRLEVKTKGFNTRNSSDLCKAGLRNQNSDTISLHEEEEIIWVAGLDIQEVEARRRLHILNEIYRQPGEREGNSSIYESQNSPLVFGPTASC